MSWDTFNFYKFFLTIVNLIIYSSMLGWHNVTQRTLTLSTPLIKTKLADFPFSIIWRLSFVGVVFSHDYRNSLENLKLALAKYHLDQIFYRYILWLSTYGSPKKILTLF